MDKGTDKRDFELFKSEFCKWQARFGLSGYRVYFKWEPVEGGFSSIGIKQGEAVATVTLNSDLPDTSEPYKDIRCSAKHEALHLLIGRLQQNGRYRFCSEEELYEATEELVNKLENLVR